MALTRWEQCNDLTFNCMILETLKSLPSLQSLSIKFSNLFLERNPRRLHGFSHLKSITIINSFQGEKPASQWADAKQLIHDNITHLEEISLSTMSVVGVSVDLESVFLDGKWAKSFKKSRPALRTLRLHDLIIPKNSHRAFPHFSNLTTIEFASPDDGIWHVMRASGVKLYNIFVSRATHGLVQYLLQYKGLEHFRLIWDYALRLKHGEAEAQNYRSLLLSQGLPHHRDSLHTFETDIDSLQAYEWEANSRALNDAEIECIQALPKLKKLRVAYAHDIQGRNSLMSVVSRC